MREQIIEAVANLKDDFALSLVKQAMENGVDRSEILRWVNQGMSEVGRLYEESEYYIADLIMSGVIYRSILSLFGMDNNDTSSDHPKGMIVIGTAESDIHDIGKDIFISLAKSEGYQVIDLGVDVSPEVFLRNVLLHKPDILAISGIITSSIQYVKETVDLIKRSNRNPRLKIIMGGFPISEESQRYLGVDFATKSADKGIMKCNERISEKNK